MSVKQTLRKYRDRSIDFADACLIRLADEFEIGDIFTLAGVYCECFPETLRIPTKLFHP